MLRCSPRLTTSWTLACLQFPWKRLLSDEEVQQGIAHYGGGSRLRRVAQKLLAGQPVKVYTLGGSVTFGHGVDDPRLSYPSLFFQFINASFPHRRAGARGARVWPCRCLYHWGRHGGLTSMLH